MNIKIFKYGLIPAEGGSFLKPITVEMPFEAQLLDAAFRDDDLYVWVSFLAENERKLTKRVFHVLVTGIETGSIHYKVKYFKTVHMPNDKLTFHIFYEAW